MPEAPATRPPLPPSDLVKLDKDGHLNPAGRRDGSGRRLWKQICGKDEVRYVLRPDELRILEDACREADLIDELATAAKDCDKLVRGSMGQRVINPLISELRQHRTALAQLLSKLKLPDEEQPGTVQGGGGEPRSTGARKAAQSRWNKTG